MWRDPIVWVLILSVVAVFPCQLLLCFKVRSIIVRLLPLVGLLIATALFAYKSFTASGWDGLGYLLIAFLTAILFGVCGLCWAIFGIVRYVKKRRSANVIQK